MNNQNENYFYIRQSTNEIDRQIQSVETQLMACKQAAQRDNVVVPECHIIIEKKSAKAPGRPEFNRLMGIVETNEYTTIYSWTFDRLSRNPKDSGDLLWYLQQNKLTIVLPYTRYDQITNAIVTSVESGQSTQYSRDNSYKVKDGMRTKARKGWRPHKPPIGYLPDKINDQGDKKIFVDPERFPLIRKLWDLLLTGHYTVPRLVDMAKDELGLRTYPTPKRPSRPLVESTLYGIFTNRFYYGEFVYDGEVYQGNHEQMITQEEFDLAQQVLGRAGRPRPKEKRLPFNGIRPVPI